LKSESNGIAVISASDEKQFSQKGITWGGGNGVFTYFFQPFKCREDLRYLQLSPNIKGLIFL
jgi:hypothetical protein